MNLPPEKSKDSLFEDSLHSFLQELQKLNSQDYRKYVEYLVEKIGNRPYNSANNIETRKWIIQTLNNVTNGNIRTQSVGSYQSILARLPSNNASISFEGILFSAHFDTVSSSPGADDNGSGIALLLYLAEVITKLNLKHSFPIYFSFNNAEEIGLYGSSEVAYELIKKGAQIDIVINADMILYGEPNLHYSSNFDFSNGQFHAKYLEFLDKFYLKSGKISSKERGSDWTRSDHYSFFIKGFPSITIFEKKIDQNPYYHSGSDIPTAQGYDYSHPVDLTKVILLFIKSYNDALKSFDKFFYSYSIDLDRNLESSIPIKEVSAGYLKVICKSTCTLLINGRIKDEVNLKGGEIYINRFFTDPGELFIETSSTAEVYFYYGSDTNENKFPDYVEEVLFDYYFYEDDLREYPHLTNTNPVSTTDQSSSIQETTSSTLSSDQTHSSTLSSSSISNLIFLPFVFLVFGIFKRKRIKI